jgi:replicative DNA helicase
MPAVQLGLRMASALGDIHSTKLRACDLDDNEFARLHDAASRYARLPILIYDKPACTPADVALQARAWQLSGGLDLLFVDYLTRLSPDDRDDSRTREVGRMVQSLKTLAKALDIPVVCFAQLSRVCEQRADKRPVMSDLRDSGEIEQEADVVAFLYRDSVYNEQADPESAEILIEKNRHGPCAQILARFIPETMTWTNA